MQVLSWFGLRQFHWHFYKFKSLKASMLGFETWAGHVKLDDFWGKSRTGCTQADRVRNECSPLCCMFAEQVNAL